MSSYTKVHVGDRVVVMNSHGLKVGGTVQSIRADNGSGRPIYKVVSPGNFVLQVYKRQIVDVRLP